MNSNIQKSYSSENQSVLEDIRRIKRLVLASMNGEVARSMAAKGVRYWRNLGVPLTRLNEIAAEFVPDRALAELLWQSQSREEMILAACLMPPKEFLPELAMKWAQDIEQLELAEIVTMKLFAKLPYAEKMAIDLLNSREEMLFFIGLSMAVRLEPVADAQFCRTVFASLFAFDHNSLSVNNLRYAFLSGCCLTNRNLRKMWRLWCVPQHFSTMVSGNYFLVCCKKSYQIFLIAFLSVEN